MRAERGHDGVRATLLDLRCIQLDPLDPMGTNADLGALARIDGIKKGDVYDALLPGHAFEHFAKERCLIPSYAFPHYRDQAVQTPWWRLREREHKLPQGVIEAVFDEVRERGPITSADLTSHGAVKAMEYHGWKGTGRATTMALEVLWTRCRLVVCGRTTRGKLYDIPQRAIPQFADAPGREFARWCLLERVEAAGLLARVSGPHWSMLHEVRKSPLVDELVAEGAVEEVTVEGARRTYLAPVGFRDRRFPEQDDRMRILGPLDPLLRNRKLVHHIFGFEYIWEVYKPAAKRRWGWYVCPLLHRGALVGRIEARVRHGALVVDNVWGDPDSAALSTALQRHARALGCRVAP